MRSVEATRTGGYHWALHGLALGEDTLRAPYHTTACGSSVVGEGR